jgi:hypothetical protein
MNKNVKYSFEEKKLKITTYNNEEREINFDFLIRQLVQFDNHALIRLEPDIGKIYNENVFCISSAGVIVWQVEAIHYLDDDSPYTNIVIKGEDLFLYNWSGERMQVNFENGKIINKTFTK